MDYETLTTCFLAVFEHYKTDDVRVFTVCALRNDLPALLEFLKKNRNNDEYHISFNGLNFDAQITQYIIINAKLLLSLPALQVAALIYTQAQECIERQNKREFPQWSERNLSIKQIDVFRLNHWDNPAKRSSLKSIQIAMGWHNVQDMPIHHTTEIKTLEQLKEIASYCRNDVSSTKRIMQLCQGQINLRGTLTKTYGIPLFSASEPRISKELFLMFLSNKTQQDPYELKKLRTFRNRIDFKDIILSYIQFDDVPLFDDLLKKFKEVSLDPNDTKGGFKHSIKYHGLKTDFGLGGVHGAKKGVYIAQEGMTIMSSDVVSFYPRLAMVNKWAPAHLPKVAFTEQYQWFFDERIKIPKKDPRNYVYKIVLNSTFGLSIDKNSFLYDPQFGMQITVNGQLSLMMLYVMLIEGLRGAIPLMQNTDGLEMIIPLTEVDAYLRICKDWEDLTKLALEHDQYQKLIIPDVNSYVGVFKAKPIEKVIYHKLRKENPEDVYHIQDGIFYHSATKRKGRLEFKDLALHKNNSFIIVAKALFYYFVHDIKPEDYLTSNRNILEYCGGARSRGDWKFVEHYIETEESINLNVPTEHKIKAIEEKGFIPAYEEGYWIKPVHDIHKVKGWSTNFVYTAIMKGEPVKRDIQKTVRYYVSKKGSKIVKVNKLDAREIQVISGKWMQSVFNIHLEKPWEEYGVDESYYLDRIYKEIKSLMPEKFDNQLLLF